ncbi:type II toxin-antitoxin system RelE/ParE family toxin [Paraburkholderia guartelaensis]|uniref:Type II toxin-antitoxin system RelE/ParE family toxin n=1 Tax=Paraburkholderia guartelaensis TaxID=2546446 RepID=A0A4R5L3I8_9BURK|nr:type II toxin-antitoxin system RelE/ParE family toxin [Paraburkholderia guartelaensis]TDG03228.1 type II toxin-antitoxin system RelE/ParE family toxin [Paraburkholderia guartelaensis]
MTAKPVIPTRLARGDVEDELTFYLVDEGSEHAALGFIAEIEQAYAHLAKHPNIGSPRYAYELDIPGLRSWPLDRYPHVIFYVERTDHVEVWRVLNGKRDIPSWLLNDDSEIH